MRAASLRRWSNCETNEAEGTAKQAELVAFAERSGMHVTGPNRMRDANFTDGIFIAFRQSFLPGQPADITEFLTQSDFVCATEFRRAKRARPSMAGFGATSTAPMGWPKPSAR